MARKNRIEIRAVREFPVTVRIAEPEWAQLKKLLFSRYPSYEWATFARMGWRFSANGLVLTIAGIDAPRAGDLDASVGHVAIQEPYTLRMALAAEQHPLAVCVVHSHPEDGVPHPSHVDDDMDDYYSKYFEGFTQGRPYISLIVSKVEDEIAVSGRVFWQSKWVLVTKALVEQATVKTWVNGFEPTGWRSNTDRLARLVSSFGQEAADRLRAATVGVVGAGGTGSASIEILARAGVGKLIVVDPDYIETSNLERLHGGYERHSQTKTTKVAVAREHVKQIDASIDLVGFVGSIPQRSVIDALVSADVVLGCTDQQHSRLALSDLALRYLVPVIDTGVGLEGQRGDITGAIFQLVRFLAADPCALCRGMIDPQRIAQELMSEQEKEDRRRAARRAQELGEDSNPYWRDTPQLNTVGFLTTTVGALAAGYAIGWITGRYRPPFSRLQANLVAELFDVTDFHAAPRNDCSCRHVRGWADQGAARALITAPYHWPEPKVV